MSENPRQAARIQRQARQANPCGSCFVAGTEVLTPSGPTAIESIRLGQRVCTYADGESAPAPAAESLDARRLRRVCFELGAGAESVRVELLRPEAWIEAHRLEVGRVLGLDLGELGVRGVGQVVSIGPCPELEAGDPAAGRIVTGRFAHATGWPMSLRLEGLEEPIGVTGQHLFWSADRNAWVAVGELEPLERVRVLGATLAVVNVSVSPRTEAVYNLEVDGEHVYRVTAAGVLVHNASCRLDIRSLGDQPVPVAVGDVGRELRDAVENAIALLQRGSLGSRPSTWGRLYFQRLEAKSRAQSGRILSPAERRLVLMPEQLVYGNAIQFVAQVNSIQGSRIARRFGLIFNMGHLGGKRSAIGHLLRPDWQSRQLAAAWDVTTSAQGGTKAGKYIDEVILYAGGILY